jgi:hypothetical protein
LREPSMWRSASARAQPGRSGPVLPDHDADPGSRHFDDIRLG